MKKRSPKGYSKHHRVPKSAGGKGNARNLSVVSIDQHRAYHCLFGIASPKEVAEILSTTWINPDYVLVAIKRG